MQPPLIWKESFRVSTFSVDATQRLSLTWFFWYFQEAAQQHASVLGWGYNEMLKTNKMWALLRVLVEFNSMPAWNEQVTITSWPKAMKGLFASRDLFLKNEKEEILARGTSLWVLLDRNTRKPVKDARVEDFRGEESLHAIKRKPIKIAWPAKLHLARTHHVAYSHLDMNGHVNNVRYLEWVMDEMSMEQIISQQPAEIEINFLNESRQGDEIAVYLPDDNVDGELSGFIKLVKDQKPVYAVRIKMH